ncbi:hypothetical protein SLA2020_106180 [Shorea laevis]
MNGPSVSRARHFLTITQCQSLLKHYGATQSITKTKQLHALSITSSLFSTQLRANIAATYAISEHIPNARKLFDELPERSSFLYNAMIRMYVNSGCYYDALNVFVGMLETGECRPDNYAYTFVVKACGELSLLGFGAVVHGRILMAGLHADTFVQNSLLAMYMNCGEEEAAEKVFDTMLERTTVSWNSMISGYFKNGCVREALMVLDRMVDLGVEMDCATMVAVLPVCSYLRELEVGRKVHALVAEKGLGKNISVRNALVDMFSKCGSMAEAWLVFDRMVVRDVVSWTSIINGYILNGDVRSAISLFPLMLFDGVRPNSVTLASLLSACGSSKNLMDGRCFHGWAVRQKLEFDVLVETSLIDMYAKCNRVDLSFQVFMKTSKKRTALWNAILSGCTHNGLAREAIEIFKQMLMDAVKPDHASLNSLLPAYAILADLQQAVNIHCYLTRSGFLSSTEVVTGLIDLYSKCGSLEYAYKIFSRIPENNKDIILWSVIIAGYGMHGHGKTAVLLFRQMVKSGIKPNEVTFTSVLHACSHAGLVDDGLNLFKFMIESRQISPKADHYTCIVDLLGRSGRLEEAYDIIRTMSFRPTNAIWGALLGACVIHENVELGEVAANQLFELEPENTGNYVLLAKIYSAVGRWKDAENVRDVMTEIGLRKTPAHSLIEVRNM